MHELSIAQSIVKSVEAEIERRGLRRVQRIVARVGALSGVMPGSLVFGFDAIKADTLLATTELVIEEVPAQAHCRTCEREFTVSDLDFTCPQCSSRRVDVTQGHELEIAYLEID
ncbi:MAG: hydrogenase maturation nickel metallochaperone HypA [Planctomycetota bacterium]